MVAEPDSTVTRRRPWASRSVRLRTTVVAVVIVASALALGGVVLVTTLGHSMSDQLRATAELQAEDIAVGLESGRPPGEFVDDDDDDRFVQIIDSTGAVVAASEDIEHLEAPVADLSDGHRATVTVVDDDDDADRFLVVAEDAEVDDHDLLVLVGRSTGIIGASTGAVTTALTVGIPVLVLLVGVTTWFVVGRTLAPVEAIRREVDAISATQLHRRVPDPGTDDEVARLAATMNRMLDRLDASQGRQRRFVSDASHELRSPVAAIRQHAEVALSHPGTTSLAEFATTVLAEDLRVQRLVEDLLFLARSDEGAGLARSEVLDLDDLVFDEARRLRATGLVRVDTSGVGAVRVEGDPSGLGRMLRNLGDNAIRHAASTVRLTLHGEAGWSVCGVEDDGAGVPPEERLRIFERFVRLDEARTRDDGGSGLGLAVVGEIVAGHRGSIRVLDSELGGARFEVVVPAVPEARESEPC